MRNRIPGMRYSAGRNLGVWVAVFLALQCVACARQEGVSTANAAQESSAEFAYSGAIYRRAIGVAVTLAPDTDNAGQVYQWKFKLLPKLSRASLSDAAAKHPRFTPDRPGTYVVQLTETKDNKALRKSLISIEATDASQVRDQVFDHDQLSVACVQCHNGQVISGKPPNHMRTSADCMLCHSSDRWKPVQFVNHDLVIGRCTACHDGRTATGKSETHPMTLQSCGTCHTPADWLPRESGTETDQPSAGAFDHMQATGACFGCHNGVAAIGKKNTHIPATNNCAACHGVLNWSPIAVDHREVFGECAVCHTAPANHVAMGTDNSCGRCHLTTAWANTFVSPVPVPVGTFDHSMIMQSCFTCHNGVQASYKSQSHPMTTDNCELCHVANAWRMVRMDHTQTKNVCADCHNGLQWVGKPSTHVLTTNNCQACHTTTIWAVVGLAFDHREAIGSCEICHQPPSNHAVVGITSVCERCHSIGLWLSVLPGAALPAPPAPPVPPVPPTPPPSGIPVPVVTDRDNADEHRGSEKDDLAPEHRKKRRVTSKD